VVGNPAALGSGDVAVRTRLQALGYSVTVVDDLASTTADASGKQLVVVSSSSFAGDVNTKFRATAVPLVTWEHALWDDLGMTAAAGTQAANQQSLVIAAPGHPMAAGLSGQVQVATAGDLLPQGNPNGNAIVVARLPGTTTASDFGYDAGATMPGLAAPARRVGLFMGDNTAAIFNANGGALFDAAITWATGGSGMASAPTAVLAGAVLEPSSLPRHSEPRSPVPAGSFGWPMTVPEGVRLPSPRQAGAARRGRTRGRDRSGS
jgi:hypothetical protein